MMDFLRSNGHGLIWKTPITHEDTHSAGFSFVDDTDPPTAHFEDRADPTPRLQCALDDWAGVLDFTGGALVPSKSFWCCVHPTLQHDGTVMCKQPPRAHSALCMTDPIGARQPAKRLPCHRGECTLGNCPCPNGSVNDALKQLHAKSRAAAIKL